MEKYVETELSKDLCELLKKHGLTLAVLLTSKTINHPIHVTVAAIDGKLAPKADFIAQRLKQALCYRPPN